MTKELYYKKFMFLFIGLWISSYNIYPGWMLPVSIVGRIAIFSLLLAFFTFNAAIFKNWFKNEFTKTRLPPKTETIKSILKNSPILSISIILFVILQIYPLTFPIPAVGDVTYHIHVPAKMFNFISSFVPMPISTYVILALIALLVLIYRLFKRQSKYTGLDLIKIPLYKYIIALSIISIAILVMLIRIPYSLGLVRFPPLGKILYLLMFGLFGLNEIGPRIVQMLFMIFATLYLCRLIRMYRDEHETILGSIIFLFLPVTFYFGRLGYLTAGTIFFTVSSLYYLFRYLEYNSLINLLSMGILVSAGFLYRRTALALIPIYLLILLINLVIKRNLKIRYLTLYGKVLWIMLVPIIPWIIISHWVDPTPMHLHTYVIETSIEKVVSIEKAKFLFLSIKECITTPLFLIFIASLLYLFLKRKKDSLDVYTLILFIGLFIFWTSIQERWIFSFGLRNTATLMPFVSIYIAGFLMASMRKLRINKQLFIYPVCLIMLYFSLSSTVFPMPGQSEIFASYVYYKKPSLLKSSLFEVYYLPFNKLFRYIKTNINPGAKILYPNKSLSLLFYNVKYKLNIQWTQDLSEDIDNIALLNNYIKSSDFDYVVLDNSKGLVRFYPEVKYKNPYKNLDLMNEFTFGKSKLSIYRVKKG